MKLTTLIGLRFSSKDWCEYAKKNGLPQHFSKWREDHLGGITGLAKSCALELGFDHIDVDPRIIESYKIAVDAGYDADIIDGLVVINKKCEVCGTPFQTTYSRRETGVCSQRCAGKKSGESSEVRAKRKETAKSTYDNRRETNRVLQSKIYSDLKFELGRDPQKKEWTRECKKNGVTSEMCRDSSPFMTYGQLKEAASMYNHKIVSIEFDCYEDVYNGTVDEFHNFFIGGFEGKLENGKKKVTFLNNLQCGEIFLRPNEFCNLTAAAARPDDTLEDLKEKVRIATIVGTVQATLTNFSYISSSWKENCEEERLLGVSIPGAMDHPILQNVSEEAESWLDDLSQIVVDTNREWAKLLGINPAAASRCQKPAGNSGELYNVASGLHARFSPYYIRRVRADAKDPLAQVMKNQGFPCEEDVMQPGSWVFSFPVKTPESAVFRDDRAAIEQLEYWLMWKKHWTDHNPSVTIYVKEHEWMAVGAWVWNHFDEVCGISFLPHSDHVYKQAPYEEITKEEYEKMCEEVPTYIDYEALKKLETSDHTVSMQEPACSAGGCDLV
jgi:hypothetical protein